MKKAATKFVSVYWFVILFLVAGGIYSMVYIFYSHPFDVRALEAKTLAYKIADCISWKGEINLKIFNKSGDFQRDFDLLKECGINFNVEDEYGWDKQEQYFANASFYGVFDIATNHELSDKNGKIGELKAGNSRLFDDCQTYGEKYKYVAKCFNKRFYAVTKSGRQILIEIFTAVRKTEKNVK
ncbi:hypothetical protein DRN73_08460 [Candidatus Pacearchaeota archaeon]|nr:MAG: hypothetical protein DRN73_08460 [Candidatus Pacearchaeota archaeon]